MKKYIFFLIIPIIIVALLLIPNFSFADDLGLGDLNDYGQVSGTSNNFNDIANKVVKIVKTVGSILSVIVLIIVGLRYMLYSTAEKAEYKKTAMAYLIGCIMIFSISNLLSIIYGIVKDL